MAYKKSQGLDSKYEKVILELFPAQFSFNLIADGG
jgi:hypothetical protein